MSYADAKKEILQDLMEGYLEQPGSVFSIEKIAARHGISATQAGFELEKEGVIRNGATQPHEDFVCSISIEGIQEIRPDYFTNYTTEVISAAGSGKDEWVDIGEATKIKDHNRIHDLGKVLELTRYFEVRFEPQQVFAKLTTFGSEFYEDHRKQLE